MYKALPADFWVWNSASLENYVSICQLYKWNNSFVVLVKQISVTFLSPESSILITKIAAIENDETNNRTAQRFTSKIISLYLAEKQDL